MTSGGMQRRVSGAGMLKMMRLSDGGHTATGRGDCDGRWQGSLNSLTLLF
jgi:hypothetical protein